MDHHASPDRKTALQIFCEEPYRLFFPLGLFTSLIGISHWLWYYAKLTDTYSCNYHGLFQMQGFEAAFVVGFLMTALPRFLEVPGARPWEIALALGAFLATTGGLYQEHQATAQTGFLILMGHLSVFAARRYLRRQDELPETFRLIPFGLLNALLGSTLILNPIPGFVKLGERLVEQGMILAFILAIAPYLGSRLLDRPERQPGRVFTLSVGFLLLLSFWIEAGFSDPIGKLLRAAVVTLHIGRTLPPFHRPRTPLWHLRFLWLSFWCLQLGLWLAGLFPDYEIVALHLTFIGGFSLLTLIIATRVIAAHCGFEADWAKNPKSLVIMGFALLLALVSRILADFYLDYYFGMLHIGAGFWLTGAIAWALVFLPKLSPSNIDTDD